MLLIAALGLLCVFTFSQVLAALASVLAVYLLARTLSAMRLMSQFDPFSSTGPGAEGSVLELLGHLLPRLDQFTRSEWLLAPAADWSTLPPLLAQTGAFGLLLVAAALFDLYRKNF